MAIVSDKPQTTRNRILGVKKVGGSTPGQIVFVDTPGIHRPLHRMNVRMVDVALETIREVDVLVVVLDASVETGAGDRYVLGLVDQATAPLIVALNKAKPARIGAPSVLDQKFVNYFPGAASRLAALFLGHICPLFSLVAPCQPGAALGN